MNRIVFLLVCQALSFLTLHGTVGHEAPRKAPKGIRLAGIRTDRPGVKFEIVMNGHDKYYRKEWSESNKSWSSLSSDGFFDMCIIWQDLYADRFELWNKRGRQGGGTFAIHGGNETRTIARRVWDGEKLVGVSQNHLEWKGAQETESFEGLFKEKHILLPKLIKWSEKWGRSVRFREYRVDRVEFLYELDDQIYLEPIKKYYGDLWSPK